MARKSKKPKKSKSGELFEHPDYEKLITVDQVEMELVRHKESLVTKDFIERRIKEEKKDYVSALNEQMKEVAEEREHVMGVIGALQDRKKQLLAPGSSTNVIQMKG